MGSDGVLFAREHARSQAPMAQAPFHRWVLPDDTVCTLFFRLAGGYLVRFPQLADFEVSADGRQVLGVPAPRVRASTLEHLFLNQVQPLALSRQGRFVLHASAVDIGGVAVAFAGTSGSGKSTLAASFAAAGRPFLTDDGLELQWQGAQPYAVPSHPSIRLNADSEAALGIDAETELALEYTPKMRFLAGPRLPFAASLLPLRALVFLDGAHSPAAQLQRLDGAAALVDIVRLSFLLDIAEQDLLSQHFDEISRLAARPIHYRLSHPRRFADLATLRALLESQLGPGGTAS